MKTVQRNLFKFSPIATAIAVALAVQFPAQVAYANSGFGDGVNLANTPIKVPTYNANSPSGPAPVLDPLTGLTIPNDITKLPTKASSGKAMRKFVDTLPGLYIPGVTPTRTVRINGVNTQVPTTANNLGQYIPVTVAEKWTDLNGNLTADDYIEIAAVEYLEKMHSDLIKPTRLRGYVQLMTPGLLAKGVVAKSFTAPDGQVLSVVDLPHHLGPVINATSGTALRVKFVNYLPVGGKLFIPVDKTVTGAGMGADGVTPYSENRVVMHLVGGGLPWISAGLPHQWIAPAGETNPGVDAITGAHIAQLDARGVSNNNVPDMADPGPGATTLYFPNDVAAHFSFYHDRTSGLTRLNAYAGMEAGYLVTDAAEQALVKGGTLSGGALAAPVTVAAGGIIPGAANTIPLIIEDKTFVPSDIAQQDALWNKNKDLTAATVLGQPGDLWFPHVYEANQDPTSALGTNPVGRFDYGPLFWPIFPAFDATPTGHTDDATIVPTAYLDTPVVNGTAYPTLTVDPKAYRFRILNASVDRYLNLGLYKADTTPGIAPMLDANGNPIFNAAGAQQFFTGTEVKLVPALADAAGNPPVPVSAEVPYDPACLCQYPTLPQNNNVASSGPARAWAIDARRGGVPDPLSVGPDIIAIGNDGGFLPNPVDIPSQPITYEANKRSITVNNAYGYGLLLGPAERSDAIIDFAKYAGQTLIVYNDAPAPFPFSDERNDYYTGNPDQTGTGGAYPTQGGYGPNTRTIMQIKVNVAAAGATPTPFDPAPLLTALPAAYAASQPAPLVPAVAYNNAFKTNDPDIYARIATGAAAQPTLDFTTAVGTNAITLTGLTLVSSGGTVNAAGVMTYNNGSGSGYDPLSPPVVVFNNTVNGVSCLAADGTSASATATVDPITRQVNAITNFLPGLGYTCLPTVSFVNTAPLTTIGVLAGGSGYTNPTVTITGDGTGASANAIVGKSVTAIGLPIGSGYTVPTVKVTGGGVAAGSVSGVATVAASAATLTVTGGTGYVLPMISYTGMGPNGVTLTGSVPASVDLNGAIQFTLTTPELFVAAPTVTVTENDPTALLVASGALTSATVDPAAGTINSIVFTPNALFSSVPTVTISNPGLADASVVVTLAATGSITGFTNIVPGSGYSAAPLVQVDENGNTSAQAIAGLAPTLGVGAQVTVSSTGGNVRSIPIMPLAEQELFDNRGRYNYTGGVEMPFTNAINQTTVPLNYIDAATEGITDVVGSDVQVWKVTVNGLFSNNLSFNMADVQLLNRVGWDGTVKPPSSNEVGWKNTVRMNPLEDMVIAVRAKRANVPFGMPKSLRLQDPSKPLGALGSEMGFTVGQGVTQLDQTGTIVNGVAAGHNRLMDYDNEYFWNSALLSNSENDFMRPIVFKPTVAVPDAPSNLTDPLGNGTLTWIDPTPAGQVATLANPKNEMGFKILKAVTNPDSTITYTPVVDPLTGKPVTVPANVTHWTQPAVVANTAYAVVAYNVAGDSAPSAPFADAAPVAPTTFAAGPVAYNSVTLAWSGNSTSNNLQVWRAVGANGLALIATLPGSATGFVDNAANAALYKYTPAVSAVQSYTYQIVATNALGSATSASVAVTTPMMPVATPTIVSAVPNNAGTSVVLRWTDNANNDTAYWVDVTATDALGATTVMPQLVIPSIGTQVALFPRAVNTTIATVPGNVYTFKVTAVNVTGGATSTSAPASISADLTVPVLAAPTTFTAGAQTATRAPFSWTVVATPVTVPATTVSYVVQVSTNGGGWVNLAPTTNLSANPAIVAGNSYQFQVATRATRFGVSTLSQPSTPISVVTAPGASTGTLATAVGAGSGQVTVNWTNASSNITTWLVQRRPNFGPNALRVYSPITATVTGAAPAYTFTDTVPAVGSYTYRVNAVNAQGNGPVATSNAVTAQ